MKKLLLSCLLALLALLPQNVSAEILEGSCGTNVTYRLDTETGALVIYGTGAIKDYSESSVAPWFFNDVRSVEIQDGVTSIGSYAFYNCPSLTSISIPESVTSIHWQQVFSGCKNLKKVIINSPSIVGISYASSSSSLRNIFGTQVSEYIFGDKITSIGSWAFNQCSGLISVNLSASVISIGAGAFSHCTSLTSVNIPANVIAIGNYAFSNCPNLSSIVVDVANEVYDCRDNCNAIIETETNCLIQGSNNTIIPSSVISIGESAFNGCSSLTSITIPTSVTNIGKAAFQDCTGLTKVEFASLESLCKINFKDNSSNPLTYAHHLYIGGKEVTNLVIPDDVTSIGNYAFNGCSYLTSATIPDGINSIGHEAFKDCSGLSSITIPEGVTSIGSGAFEGCNGLISASIPKSCTEIAWSQFQGCSSLTSITIPFGVTNIGPWAFSGCSSLTSINIPKSVTKIETYAFNSTGLTSVVIPPSVTSIGEYAFSCKLSSVVIPPNVTLHRGAFTYSDLTSVTIPVGVHLSHEVFRGCKSLYSATLSEGVNLNNNGVFRECDNLNTINIPSTVTTIGAYAFYKCWNLTSMISYAKVPPSLYNYAFGEVPLEDVTLMVYESCADAYKEATGWKRCNIVTMPDPPAEGTMDGNLTWTLDVDGKLTVSGVGAIANFTYESPAPWHSYRRSIKSVEISKGITCVGRGAFEECINLSNVTIPSTVTSIKPFAFYRCSSLSSIVIPSSVVNIGEYAFSECTSLYDVTNYARTPQSITDETFPTYGTLHVQQGCGDAYRNANVWKKFTIVEDLEPETIGGKLNDNITWQLTNEGKLIISGTGSIPSYSYESSVPWYSYRENIKSVEIQDGVTSIGSYAFSGCKSLTSIIIPKSVTSIGTYAFWNCSSLTSINIPKSVTSIGSSAFNGCSSLTSITVDVANKVYDSRENCNAIIKTASNTLICGCKSTIIPSSVTSIGSFAFSECSSLTSINIPEGVTSIGDATFNGCKSLTSINIPEGVTSIGDATFNGCKSLTSINIPEGVTSIGNYAFSGCSSLTSVVSYAKVPPTCGSDAFKSVPSNATMTVYKSSADVYKTADGWKDFTILTMPDKIGGNVNKSIKWELTEDGTLVISGTGEMTNYTSSSKAPWYSYISSIKSVEIQDGVTHIGDTTFFYCSNLTSINIPESVTSIGHSAFQYCSSLTSVNIPKGVTSIGSIAFGSCNGLTSITVDADNKVYDSRENCNAIIETASNTLICGCKNTIIPKNVTSIGNSAFYECSSLTSIIIPEGIVNIGIGAFYGCSSLTSINIPEGVTRISDWAFFVCSSLTSIAIPEGVTSIGEWAFRGCWNLASINIPASVTSIGEGAFSFCNSLTSVSCNAKTPPTLGYGTFPSSATFHVLPGSGDAYRTAEYWKNFTILEDLVYAFDPITGKLTISGTGSMYNYKYVQNIPWYHYRESITTIEIQYGVTSIGENAFCDCSSLTSITIPEGVTSIGSYAFQGCSSLTSITIPEGVTYIDNYAFSGCSSITSINIPEGVTSIGRSAFSGCSSLTSINIPEGVTSIGQSAFNGCSNLTSINIPEGVTSISDFAFCFCSSLTSITIPESVTSIGNYAFYECSSLTSINIPKTVISIGEGAFRSCSSLTSITIPESVTSIGNYAFYECSSLTSITIPEGVTSIGEYAFNGCSSLTSINIPESVTTIGKNAFFGCSNLTSVVIPNGVTFIGRSAFSYCSSLVSVTIPVTVSRIDNYAFNGCDALTSVSCYNSVPPTVNSPFSTYGTLHVLSGYKDVYEQAETWKNFTIVDDLQITPDMIISGTCGTNVKYTLNPYIGKLVISGRGAMDNSNPWYRYRESIKSIEIQEGVTSIGSYAFSGCSSLTSISIPNSVTSIGYGVFAYCRNLPQIDGCIYADTYLVNLTYFSTDADVIVVKDGTRFIGPHAFYPSVAESIILPESVISIGDSAFIDCKYLTSVSIPKSVTNIGKDAFMGCSSLKQVECASMDALLKIDLHEESRNLLKNETRLIVGGSETFDIAREDKTADVTNPTFENGYNGWQLNAVGGTSSLAQEVNGLTPGLYEVTLKTGNKDITAAPYFLVNGYKADIKWVNPAMAPIEPSVVKEPEACLTYFKDTLFFAEHCQMSNSRRVTNVKTATLATPAYYKSLDVNSDAAKDFVKVYYDTPEDKALFLDVYSWHNYRNAKKSSRDAEPMIADKPMFMPLTFEEVKKVDEIKGQTTYQDRVLKAWEDGIKINPNDVLKYEQYLKDYAEWQKALIEYHYPATTTLAIVGTDGKLSLEIACPENSIDDALSLKELTLTLLTDKLETAVDEITGEESILGSSSTIYDLNGRKVQNIVPGHIYIQNSKKFIAK